LTSTLLSVSQGDREAAGLAVGILALVGTFTECIELISYISAARSLGRDFEILDTKLDIEKTLLLPRAQTVRLLKPNHDTRLNDGDLQGVVGQTLAYIRLLVSDSQALASRYGLAELKDDQARDFVIGDTIISKSHMVAFVKEMQALNMRTTAHPANVSTIRRVQWAVHDKHKFEDLINVHARRIHWCGETQRTGFEIAASSLRHSVSP
jgi:Prion-inhibition and propagation